jgi:Xaa-Pro aminopeptidase
MDNFKSILKDGTAALIITDVNRRYLTGFESSLGYLFVTESGAKLLIDGRYYLAAKQSVKNADVVLLGKLSEQLTEWVRSNNIKTVLLESAITINTYNRIKEMLSSVEVKADGSVDEKLSELRSVKTADELGCIIAAQRIAERAFLEVLNFIEIGVTEHRIATELEYRMRLFGSEDKSFDTIVVSGEKSAMPHGVPDGKFIERGDFITMDFGATVGGITAI